MGKDVLLIRQRDYYADFLKYFLIWTVVLGHFINLYQYSRGYGGIFNCIYSFHMPLFVFISGYFSKHLNSYKQRSIDTLLYPFILFQLLNILYTIIIPIEPLNGNVFYPYHQNWYLIALFWWRSFSPYKQFFKDKAVIIATIIISLGIGFFPEWNGFLGLYKTAYFLPFFIIGSYCDDLSGFINKLLKYKLFWQVVFVSIMSLLLILSFNIKALIAINYGFCAREGYGGDIQNLMIRVACLSVSFFTCCSVLVVTKIVYEKYSSMIDKWMLMGGVQFSHI